MHSPDAQQEVEVLDTLRVGPWAAAAAERARAAWADFSAGADDAARKQVGKKK